MIKKEKKKEDDVVTWASSYASGQISAREAYHLTMFYLHISGVIELDDGLIDVFKK